MTIKQQRMNRESVGKLTLSVLGLSALLAVSACSGGDNTNENANDSVNEATPDGDVETAIVEVEKPVVNEAAAATDEHNVPTATTEAPADEAAVMEAAKPPLAVDAGAKLYEVQCKICHESGLLNAPKYGDTAAWSTRITRDRETLYMHSAQGFNKMPAQVNDNVSEAQVHAAVDYMLAAVS